MFKIRRATEYNSPRDPLSQPQTLTHGHKSNANLTAKEKTSVLIDAMNIQKNFSSSIDNLHASSPDNRTLVVSDTQHHQQQPK